MTPYNQRRVVLCVNNPPADVAVGQRIERIDVDNASEILLFGQRVQILHCWVSEVPANAITLDGEPITLDGAYLLWVA